MRARLTKIGKYLLLAVLGLVLFVFLWVQTGVGLPGLVSRIVSGTGALGEATLQIGSLRGNLFNSLTAEDISLTLPTNQQLAEIDRLHVDFAFLPLLRGDVHLKQVQLDNPSFYLQQNEDGIWDISLLSPEQKEEKQDDTASSTTLQIDDVHVSQFNLAAAAYNPDKDSTYHVERVNIDLSDIRIGDAIALDIQSIAGAVGLPERADSVKISIEGALSDNVLSLESLRLESEQSNVYGAGTLGLQWQDSLFNKTEFALRANPLSFDDIRLFAPGLSSGQSVDIMLSAKGQNNSLDLTNTIYVTDGASIISNAAITRQPDSLYDVSIESEIKQLNPQTFNTGSLPAGNLNLQIATALQGTKLKDITGTTQASMVGSSLAASVIDTTILRVQWINGRADLSFLTGVDDIDASLAGVIYPFSEKPTYDISGTLSQLDIARFTDSTFTSDLDVDLRVAGESFNPQDGVIDAYIDVKSSRLNLATIDTGTIHASIVGNQVRADAQLDTQEGTFATQTLLNLQDDVKIETLFAELDRLNINALINNPTPSSISGNLTADAHLTPEPEANWALSLGSTSYGEYTIESSTIEGTLEAGLIEVSTETAIHGGTINIEAALSPFEDQIIYEIKEGSFSDLSIGPIIQNPDLSTDLNGSFSLKGEGTEVSGMQTSGLLSLSPSQVNNQPISEAELSFSLAENVLESALNILMPSSAVQLEAQIDSLSGYPALSLPEGRIRNLNIGSFTGDTTLTSSLNVDLAVSASGTSIENLFLDAKLDVMPSTINGATINDSQINAYYRDNLGRFYTDLSIDDGSITIQADTLVLGDTPTFTFQGDITNINLANLANLDSLESIVNLSIQGRGTGAEPQRMRLQGIAASTNTFFGDAQIEQANMDFLLNDGLLRINQLNLVSNLLTLDGSGNVALYDDEGAIASDFLATGSLTNLRPLAPLIGAEALDVSSGDFEINLLGPPGVLQFDSKLDIAGILYNEYRIGVIDARLAGNLDENRQPSSVTVSGKADQVSLPGFAMDEVIYSAIYADSTVQFNLDNQVDAERSAQINGTLSLYADSQYVSLETVNLKLDEDQWSLKQPTQVSLGMPIVVDDFHLGVEGSNASSSQYFRLNGTLDVEGEQDVQLDINELNIGTLASLFGSEGLDGTLNLKATLQGEAESPKLAGDMNLSLISFDRSVGNLAVSVDYDSLRLNLDAKMYHKKGDSLTIAGFLPVDLTLAAPDESTTGRGISQNLAREGDVQIDIKSDSLVIGWLLPFIDQSLVDRLDGALETDIKIRGTGEDPELSGQGRFINGIIHSPIVGVTFRDINSSLSLQENVISFSNTSTRTGEGRFDVQGEIRLQDLANAEIDISMQADEFNVINTREIRSTLSGDLEFSGTMTQPVLTGNVELLNTDVFIDNSTSQELADLNVQLTEEDLRMLENNFGVRPTARDTATSDTYEAMNIDIDIELGRDTWIRSRTNPEMNVQFNGELDFTKRPYGEQEMFGAIEVNPDRSYITQFGKRFEINQGTITFNGPATDPILNFEARYEVPSRRGQDNAVTVYMDIEGTMETLALTFRSDPTMELTDMVSYVVTGQPASEALQLGGMGNQSAESIAVSSGVGLLSNAIESLVQGSGLELDVIQIEPLENARGATITAGKYVTPRLFTAVSQPIGAANADGSTNQQGTIVTLELELIDSLLLRLLGGESIAEINLLWHYAY